MEDTAMQEGSPGVFADLRFAIIPNGLTATESTELESSIVSAGGKISLFDTSKDLLEQFKETEYIIATTSDFPGYHTALDLMKHVVQPAWVGASLRSGKVKNPRTYSPDPALFMNEVVVCCGSLPSGDVEAIQGGVLAMGGQYSEQLSKSVTHLIALSMDEERCRLVQNKRLQVKILLPHWFDDCLKVGRRLNERPYLLPDPEIFNNQAGAIPSTKTSQQIRDATTPDPLNDPMPQSPSSSSDAPRGVKPFEGKGVKLGDDLELNTRLKDTITGLIEEGGGRITTDLEDTSMYICKYRDGPDYVKASQDSIDVGNLSWLYYMITHKIWTDPMRRMLHYPRPREGIPGFEGYKISISSYTGEARVYLENLVRASGAEFTKTFKQDNTHLVTAHKNSEKCEAAQEWGVNVVNHLWLEESYSRCKALAISDTRYTFFPRRTNLGEILGQTEIDREATEKQFFNKARKPTKPAPPSPVSKTKRTKSMGEAQTPLPTRHASGKENPTPGSRGAKDRAMSKLHDAAEDIGQYEKEMKRKGGVVHGGRRRTEDEVEAQTAKPRKSKDGDSITSKRSIGEVDEEEGSEDDLAETATKNKKAKKDKLTPIAHRMLISKDDRWAANDEKASKEKARLRELGLLITDDYKRVDLLCAPTVVRTKKFVAAMACAPKLVSSSYLDYALKNNRLPPPEKHPLDAADFEKEHGFLVSEAIERARQNKHRLLKDWTIFCTPKVSGGIATYREIIEANGGKCMDWKGKAGMANASKRLVSGTAGEESQNQKEDEGDVLYLISEADKREFPNWVKFREMAAKHDMVPRIVKTEWLLIVAMAQYVHWKKEWELTEDIVKARS